MDFGYHPDPRGNFEARLTICNYYRERGVAISPEQLFLTASTSEAYAYLFKLLCDPNDEVLIPVPSYPLFTYLGALEAIRTVPYHLHYDGSWYVDFQSLKSAISERTKAIVTVNPNNPTGTFLNAAEREEMFSLAAKHDLALIADEVFADYCLFPNKGASTCLAGHTGSSLSFSLNGLSKAAGMPQMKLAWIVMDGPAETLKLATDRLEMIADTFLSVGAIPQRALPKLLELGGTLRSDILQRISHNLKAIDKRIRNTAVQRLHMDGGWSAILRIPNTRPEEYWVTSLIEEHGLITQPGYFFDMPQEAYLVISLITPRGHIEAGVDILCEHVARHS